ncbi:MAG: hypothetical protein JW849_06255 [Phycisphaerae bacterium]|nr:hypothetical protein [Phycisphaerae bacterium]
MTQEPQKQPAEPIVQHEDLRQIAKWQKTVLVCVLIYLIGLIFNLADPMGLSTLIRGIIMFAVGLIAVVFVFMLAIKIYHPAVSIVLCIVLLIPLVGIIPLLIINGRATSIMKQNGISVGLLGADMRNLQ